MRLDARFEQDELKVLRLLADHSSVSGGVFGVLGINRAAAREALEELRYRRALQATFRSIICATRFGFFRQGPFYRLCATDAETWILWRTSSGVKTSEIYPKKKRGAGSNAWWN